MSKTLINLTNSGVHILIMLLVIVSFFYTELGISSFVYLMSGIVLVYSIIILGLLKGWKFSIQLSNAGRVLALVFIIERTVSLLEIDSLHFIFVLVYYFGLILLVFFSNKGNGINGAV